MSRCSTKLVHFFKNYHLHWIVDRANIICKYCTSICMSSKSVSQIFKILFQTGDINIFVLRGVFFSRYIRLKTSFPDEKNISGEI